MSVRHRILLVDDEEDLRSVMATALATKFEVVEASDGLDALQKLEDAEPDFAILDARMPMMDGFQLCEAIRRHDRTRAIPVLFLSAYGSKENIQRGYRAGCNLYMKKPIDPIRVIKNVEFTIQHEQTPVRKKRYSLDELKQRAQEAPRERRVQPGPERAASGGGSVAPERPVPSEPRTPEWNAPSPPPPPHSEPVVGPLQESEELDFNIGARTTPHPKDESRGRSVPESEPSAGTNEGKPGPAQKSPAAASTSANTNGAYPASDFEATPGAKLRPRVMIVDNEDDMRNLMDIALRTRFEVTTARNGVEAVENIVQYEPDILILDLMMPKMNGYQLLQSIRRNQAYKHMPVIVVSGKATPRDQNYIAKMGANAFIAKPFKIQQLDEALTEVMSPPEFTVKPKRLSIDEIVEREFLKAKENLDVEDQPDRLRKFAEIQEIINRRKEH